MSVANTSLPGISIYDLTTQNTLFTRVHSSPEDNERTTKLKSLLEESLMQESQESPEKTKEQRPKSTERCIEPTSGLLVEGKTMQLQVRSLTSPMSRKKLERIVFKE